jgi:2'-hydroxyisoflavone reductase
MRVLVLGGTAFVGRAIVDALLAGRHAPTLFTRGRTGADLFPEVPRLVGDRSAGDYASLVGTDWDAVVDVSAYVPREVGQVGAALGAVGRYLFVSTGSVYDKQTAQLTAEGVTTEDSPRLAPHRASEESAPGLYGPLKVACEDDVLARYGDRATIVRPGIVAGPHDPTDRFTWWVRAAAAGGRVEVPGRLDQPVQVVDARDLAALVTALLTDDRPGAFNAVGPAVPITLRTLLETCASALGTEVDPVEVPLREGFPLLTPSPDHDVMFRRSAARAHAAGLPATPLEQTARDVRGWDLERGLPDLRVG